MGTNYYRVPTVEEMEERRARLLKHVESMEMSAHTVERGFHTIPLGEWDYDSPWSEFLDGTSVHLGKRSGGWKFLWNFNKDKYYHNQESLYQFINSGRVVNEYGEEIPTHEFIEMALTWGQMDGWDLESYYRENPHHHRGYTSHERYVDGLRVSDSTEFS